MIQNEYVFSQMNQWIRKVEIVETWVLTFGSLKKRSHNEIILLFLRVFQAFWEDLDLINYSGFIRPGAMLLPKRK